MALPDTGVAIIGAGPAGIAAALALLKQGIGVMVLDDGPPPSPRIESLAANGIELALACGLAPALQHAGLGHAAAMNLHWREQPETKHFGTDGPLLLDRVRFHAALRRLLPPAVMHRVRVTGVEARADPAAGAVLRTSAGPLRARFVIDARGRARLKLRRGGAPLTVSLGFAGVRPASEAQPTMLMEALPDGWLWACLLPGGGVSGALFLSSQDLAGLGAKDRASCLAHHLGLSRLGALAQLSAGRVMPSSLVVAEDPFTAPAVLKAGDAALANDPLASHGLVHALRSGVQAAAAAATLLDPAGEGDAARCFIVERHKLAARTARNATRNSLAGQARFHGGFWSTPVAPDEQPARPPRRWPALSRPLALGPLRRTALLAEGRISWADAVWLPASAQAAPVLGPFSAAMLAQLLAPPAPVAVLSARLERAGGAPAAQAVLRLLLEEGALGNADAAQAPAPTAISA